MSYQAGLAINRPRFMCGATVAAENKPLCWATIAGDSNG